MDRTTEVEGWRGHSSLSYHCSNSQSDRYRMNFEGCFCKRFFFRETTHLIRDHVINLGSSATRWKSPCRPHGLRVVHWRVIIHWLSFGDGLCTVPIFSCFWDGASADGKCFQLFVVCLLRMYWSKGWVPWFSILTMERGCDRIHLSYSPCIAVCVIRSVCEWPHAQYALCLFENSFPLLWRFK